MKFCLTSQGDVDWMSSDESEDEQAYQREYDECSLDSENLSEYKDSCIKLESNDSKFIKLSKH